MTHHRCLMLVRWSQANPTGVIDSLIHIVVFGYLIELFLSCACLFNGFS